MPRESQTRGEIPHGISKFFLNRGDEAPRRSVFYLPAFRVAERRSSSRFKQPRRGPPPDQRSWDFAWCGSRNGEKLLADRDCGLADSGSS